MRPVPDLSRADGRPRAATVPMTRRAGSTVSLIPPHRTVRAMPMFHELRCMRTQAWMCRSMEGTACVWLIHMARMENPTLHDAEINALVVRVAVRGSGGTGSTASARSSRAVASASRTLSTGGARSTLSPRGGTCLRTC
jgi:hypothetical protein